MIRAYAVSDVRAVEAAAMAQLPDGELMQRAARGLAEVLAARLRELGATRVVALVGGGDNGGDALYAAALLADPTGPWADAGHRVSVVSAGPIHPGGRAAAEAAGVTFADSAAPGDPGWPPILAEAEVVLDAITGIGGRPGLRAPASDWVAAIPDGAYVVAVDLPSGVDPQGRVGTAECVFADETVTFGAPKPCHLLPAGEPAVGRLTVVDIGLDFGSCTPAVERLTHDDVAALWPRPGAASDKYSRGVLGIVAGSTAYPGAGVLSVLGALGVGVGMVRYLGPDAVARLVHRHAPEAVTATGRVQAWVLGSGVDPDDHDDADQLRSIRVALDSSQPCVVDAGALAVVGPRPGWSVLTPHAGELARLLSRLDARPGAPDARVAGAEPGADPNAEAVDDAVIVDVTREDVVADPVAHAQAAADALGAVVLLKGSTTLVVCPSNSGRPIRSQTDAPPWLATAGAGDVLGGVIGSLLAGGLDPGEAAALGALVHGVAAERTNPGGPVRMLSVANQLPEAVAALLR